MTSKCPICGSDLGTGYNCTKCGYPQNEARETALCHAYYKTGYEQAKFDMRNKIKSAIAEITFLKDEHEKAMELTNIQAHGIQITYETCINIIRKHAGIVGDTE